MRALAICLSVCLLAAPAMAGTQAQPEETQPITVVGEPLAAPNEAAEEATLSDTAAQEEKRVCRTQRITGSLTRRIRTCMTQRQWDRQAEIARRGHDAIVDDGNESYARQLRSRSTDLQGGY